jgi:ribonuclease Z
MGLQGRTADLYIYAPALLETILLLQLEAAKTTLPFPLHFKALEGEGSIYVGQKITVEIFKVSHRIDCWGFLFRERKKPRKLDPQRVKSYEIPASFYDALQMGSDYTTKKGTIIPNEEVTIPNTAGRSYAYCADTIYDERIAEKVKQVNVLYHEATYLKDLEERAAARFHSTTTQAASIALKAGVDRLLIGHFSSKYELLDEFLSEACEVFPQTELALEGLCFKI